MSGLMTRREVIVAALAAVAAGAGAAQAMQKAPDPWTAAQTVQPADLVKELAGPAAARPTVVCTGVRTLYRAGHIPGASFHGPAGTPEGLTDLKGWAQPLPRSTNVVLYCGCCPFDVCPNARPAFAALRDMGFTHLRVVVMPNNFATDWVGKEFPVER